jgi:2-oxoglutarate ferredoxin oxidoreductase subunit alpha
MTGAVVKVNSYAHDESGITTEEAETVVQMTRKRLRKGRTLSDGMGMYDTVNVSGAPDAGSAIVCWGSTKGACGEVADKLGMRVVRPVVLSPFPAGRLKNALEGVSRLIVIEENATGQLAALLRLHGIPVDAAVLHCDGRQLTPDIIVSRMREVMA